MHWYTDPILHHYADFTGRAIRQEYWMFFLFNLIISIVVGLIGEIIGLDDILSGLYALILLLPSIGLTARRLHDINKSGWWQLICLIPVLGFLVMLYFLVQKGDVGANRFGPNLSGSGVGDMPSANPADTSAAATSAAPASDMAHSTDSMPPRAHGVADHDSNNDSRGE